MTKTIERPKVEKLIEPAKRWRNRWRTVRYVRFEIEGVLQPGKVFDSHWVWPSKEVAEQKAADSDHREIVRHGKTSCEYLGAHPVET